jgi:hypothetical protein
VTKFRYEGDHADVLADGTPIGPGDPVTLDAAAQKKPHNKRLIAEGKLRSVPKSAQPATTKTTPTTGEETEGRI